MLDLTLLRTFATVADAGGFTRAASELHMTQSAVSVQVRRLEEAVGKRLLNRTSRHVAPTADGDLLLGYARRLLMLHDEAVGRLEEGAVAGTVRFGATEHFPGDALTRLLADFRRGFPRAGLEIEIGLSRDLLEQWDHGRLDLVLAVRSPLTSGGELLWREGRVWVAQQDLVFDRHEPLPLVMLAERCISRQVALAALEAAGVAYRVMFTSRSISGVRKAARAGLGIAVLPTSAVTPGLRVIDGDAGLPPLPDFEFTLFGGDRTTQPAVSQLADLIRRRLTTAG